jgi:hypothetical protein
MAIRHESTQIRWFLRWSGGRLDLITSGQRRLKGQLTLSQDKMKKGDDIADDDNDDAVRTSMLHD